MSKPTPFKPPSTANKASDSRTPAQPSTSPAVQVGTRSSKAAKDVSLQRNENMSSRNPSRPDDVARYDALAGQTSANAHASKAVSQHLATNPPPCIEEQEVSDSSSPARSASHEVVRSSEMPPAKKAKFTVAGHQSTGATTTTTGTMNVIAVPATKLTSEQLANTLEGLQEAFNHFLGLCFLQLGSVHPIGDQASVIRHAWKQLTKQFHISFDLTPKQENLFGNRIERLHHDLYQRIVVLARRGLDLLQLGPDVTELTDAQYQQVLKSTVTGCYAEFRKQSLLCIDDASEIPADEGPLLFVDAYLKIAMPSIFLSSTHRMGSYPFNALTNFPVAASRAARSMHNTSGSDLFDAEAVLLFIQFAASRAFPQWSALVKQTLEG